MRSVNKVILVGNVGAAPEIRSTQQGVRVAQVSLATSRRWKNAAGAEQEATQWHRLILWDKLADLAEKWIKKGSKLYVEGEIEYRQYTKQDNTVAYTTEIRVREISLLGDPVAAGRGAAQGDGGKGAPGYGDDVPQLDGDDDLPF